MLAETVISFHGVSVGTGHMGREEVFQLRRLCLRVSFLLEERGYLVHHLGGQGCWTGSEASYCDCTYF